ncbi:MAG: Phosphoglycerate mutase [Candidatus Woesebacteria bacterium GW2011_GWB1_39_10]|uniref:Phosphoglycerate mutase n=1 Tax=Candidatus Woesebacteria bacterium GW2011_GWB1_39_10 TaxID=1618572 RepID=A0A0G0LTR1_9BACT|nr:MAG: Phosphoglycerate mutase [Candidatus Woesebacteria bacterium GW2011_GWB1_39_10]
MSKLYFITHPSVHIVKVLPIDQWGLSSKGINEVKRLLKLSFWNEISIIYSSPEKKAIQTAELISREYGIKIFTRDNLSEVDRSSTGFMEYGKYLDVVRNFYKHPKESIQGWESAAVASKRIFKDIAQIMSKHKNKSIVVIGHGATGTLLACSLLNKEPDFAEDTQGTGRYMIIDWNKRQLVQKWLKY